MHVALFDKIVLEIKVSHPRPTLFVQFGRVCAFVCLEDPAPPGARLPFYEHRKWRADIAIERQWWIGRLAASLSMPRRAASSELTQKLAEHRARYETATSGIAAYLVKD
jgi:hypothetical protein